MLFYLFEETVQIFFTVAFNSFSLFSKDSFWGITGLDEAFFFAGWWDNDFVYGVDLLGAGFLLVIKGGGQPLEALETSLEVVAVVALPPDCPEHYDDPEIE